MHTNLSFDNFRTNFIHRLTFLLPVFALLSSQIFFFGPLIIFSGNEAEFTSSALQLLYYFVIPAIVLGLGIIIIGLLLASTAFNYYVSLLTCVGFLLWLQGNFLVWDYGLADGRGSLWALLSWQAFIDSPIWLILLTISVLGASFFSKFIRLFTLVILAVQVIGLIASVSLTPQSMLRPVRFNQDTIANKAIFEFSKSKNIIHIILDELQSTVFKEIVSKESHYYSELDGFIFFENTLSNYPTTLFSIANLITGKSYDNTTDISSFLDKSYRGLTLPSILINNGYRVDLIGPYASQWYCKSSHSICYEIPVPYGKSSSELSFDEAVLLLDMTLFRYSPHILKGMKLSSGIMLTALNNIKTKDYKVLDNFEGDSITKSEANRHLAHDAFLTDLIERSTATLYSPVYKFIHITTSHYPAFLSADCKFLNQMLPWEFENITNQARCVLNRVLLLLAKLKKLGIYDNSIIVLHADHGYWKVNNSDQYLSIGNSQHIISNYQYDFPAYFAQIVSSALPLLAIKPFKSKGIMKTSKVPASLSDIPRTVIALADIRDSDFPGEFLFNLQEDIVRPRIFYYYDSLPSGKERMERLDKFVVLGNPLDKKSWNYLDSSFGIAQSSSSTSPLYYSLGKIMLAMPEGQKFLRSGWSLPEKQENNNFIWALGNTATIWCNLPSEKSILLRARLKAPRFKEGEQLVTVSLDGEELSVWHLDAKKNDWKGMGPETWAEYEAIIPPRSKRPSPSIMQFAFSRQRPPDEREKRPLAVLFESLEFTEIKK